MNIHVKLASEDDLTTIFALIKEFTVYHGKSNKVKTSLEDFKRNKECFYCLLAESDAGDIAGYPYFLHLVRKSHLSRRFVCKR